MTRGEAIRIAKKSRAAKPTYKGRWRWQSVGTSMDSLLKEWCRNVIYWDTVAVEEEERRLFAIETTKQMEADMVIVQGVEVPV